MPWIDLAERIRFYLDADRAAADRETERRVYTVQAEDITGIYHDVAGGSPARGIGGATIAAVAGENAVFELFNPPSSGVDAIVERGQFVSGATGLTLAYQFGGLGEPAATQGRRDRRTPRALSCELRAGTNPAPGAAATVFGHIPTPVPGWFPTEVQFDILLPPGATLLLWTIVVNVALAGSLWWSEYVPARTIRG